MTPGQIKLKWNCMVRNSSVILSLCTQFKWYISVWGGYLKPLGIRHLNDWFTYLTDLFGALRMRSVGFRECFQLHINGKRVFPQLYWNRIEVKLRTIKGTKWWFDAGIYCEMIIKIKLVNSPITSRNYRLFLLLLCAENI